MLALYMLLFISPGNFFLNQDLKQNAGSANQKNIQITELNEEDSSGFSSDGPVVVYDAGNIISYCIKPDKNNFNVSREQINKTDKLTCRIDETNQQFDFKLKYSINIEKDVYELPDKMLIVSDIEGNFRGFSLILKGAGVINEDFGWIFGNGHLVLCGDFFDRGINVTECLWLIYKLENEAELQGGKVHFILGNHELMNMRNDFRYVRKKYLVNADSLNLNYQDWYDVNTELGKWLRSKNGIEKIGDFLFLHAGISKDFPKDTLSLNEINNNIRASLDKIFEKGEASKDNFIGSNSPLWYRGIVNETETQQDIENTLFAFNASKMIIGHTIVERIKFLYNNKIIAIDIEHKENTDKGIMYALWYDNGEFFTIDNNGIKTKLN